jgi:hypothetical protein
MGCDIHFYVEVRKDDQWISVDDWTKDNDDGRKYGYVDYRKAFYSGRNYDLFAILANVRNGYGFAGVDTGSGFIPIAMPKGLPVDVSLEVKQCAEYWDADGQDGHSHSWHTLADLLAYDWTQTSERRGVIDIVTFQKWESWGRGEGKDPDGWSGSVSGPDVQILSEEEARQRIEAVKTAHNASDWDVRDYLKQDMPYVYVKAAWTQPYYKCCLNFWGTVIPRLLRLGKPEDVRIVFWFDN